MTLDEDDERRLAAALFNQTWTLLDKPDRSSDEDDAMLHMAHASRHHWGTVGTATHRARGEWQVSRVYASLQRPEPCLHHAQRVVELCEEHGLSAFDRAFGYEALARGRAIAGDAESARALTEQALALVPEITDDEDREFLLGDLASIPGQPRFW